MKRIADLKYNKVVNRLIIRKPGDYLPALFFCSKTLNFPGNSDPAIPYFSDGNRSSPLMRHLAYKEKGLRRTSRLSVMLNSREMRALGIYCSRYRIKNKSEFLRVTLMKAIIQRFEDEHPSLWEEPEPTLFDRRGGKKVLKVS